MALNVGGSPREPIQARREYADSGRKQTNIMDFIMINSLINDD